VTTPEGEAFIDVHANTRGLEGEMEHGVKSAAERAENDLSKAGDNWGKALSKSLGERLEKDGPSLSDKIMNGLRRKKIKAEADVDVHTDNNRISRSIQRAFEDAVEGTASSGLFSKLGQGIADAIGAGFNVSGKSSLITLLIPVVGAIIGLVAAAIQAVGALVTLLATLPTLLLGIGAQVGVLFIAFHGLGTAIQGAFAAKNAKELKEALKDLTPAAQSFVKELLPLRKLFTDIQKTIQQTFFRQIVGDVTALANVLGSKVKFGLAEIADLLGRSVHQLALFLESPTFLKFIDSVFDSTSKFIENFGPALGRFLGGLTELATAAQPLLDDFGKSFSDFVATLGATFHDIANDPDFQKWLKETGKTIDRLFELVKSVSGALTSFTSAIDKAGGNEAISELAHAFDQLAFFFQTPLGQEGLKGLIDMGIESFKIVTGLFEALLTLIAVIKNTPEALGAFFDWVGGKILGVTDAIGRWFVEMWKKVSEPGAEFIDWVKGLPGRVIAPFRDAGALLLKAGRDIIGGLIQGMKNMVPDLSGFLGFIGQKIRNFFPFSPAKEGPLSGQGDPRIAGQKIVTRLGEGIHMELPKIEAAANDIATNIVFGRGAIVQNFQGLPDRGQATRIGDSVAGGIANGLIARDVRMAVRTL
jgi:hypothetical protein